MAPRTPSSGSTPIFSTSIFSSSSASRPATRDGGSVDPLTTALKDRKPSFSRKSSLSRRGSSFGNGPNAYVTDAAAPPALPDYALAAAAKITPRADIRESDPSIHHSSSTTAADSAVTMQMLSRSATGSTLHLGSMPPPATPMSGPNGAIGSGTLWQQSEAGLAHQQITEVANKRISTLEYLRKAYVHPAIPRLSRLRGLYRN